MTSELVEQMRAFVAWVGAGRKLTQTGRVTMTDARVLVESLGTGDVLDPAIGDRVYRTTSSQELRNLTLVVEWAKSGTTRPQDWQQAGGGQEERRSACRPEGTVADPDLLNAKNPPSSEPRDHIAEYLPVRWSASPHPP